MKYLYTKARPRSKTPDPQLRVKVSWRTPSETVIQTLHQHCDGGIAVVMVEAHRVDEYHSTGLLIHNNRTQVQPIW